MAKKGIPKEQIISTLVVYEQNQLLPLTKQFKINFKQLQTRELENENYRLLVSSLTAFTG